MKINRLFEILNILLNRENVTAKYLAEHFEVSTRTIYRDIDALSESGFPIYTNKGKGGGIALLDNFVLNKSILSKEDQRYIISAIQGLRATNFIDKEGVLEKLSALFKDENNSWIEVDFSDWSEKKREEFNVIKSCIVDKKLIEFYYYNSYGVKSKRKIEPLKLKFKERAWYVIGFCREKNDIRMFKLNRIKNIKVINEVFTRKYESFQEEKRDYKTVKIKLKISGCQAYRVYDEFEEENIEKNKDGSFNVVCSYPVGEWVLGYILSFGRFATVLEPQYIKDEIIKSLNASLTNYLEYDNMVSYYLC